MLSKGKQKDGTNMLFEAQVRKPVLPQLESSVLEDLYDEIELIGFTVSAPVFDLVRSGFRGDVPAKELASYAGKVVRMVGDFVTDKHVRTKNGTTMKFGTFLDTEGTFFDTVHFPQSLTSFPLNGNGVFLVEGKVVVDFGCPAIEVQRIARMPVHPDPRSV